MSLWHDGAGASACDAHLGSVKLARVESSPGENPSKHTVALLALRASLHGKDDEAALAFGKAAGITVPGVEEVVREQLSAGPD